jgi:hypothetical protein
LGARNQRDAGGCGTVRKEAGPPSVWRLSSGKSLAEFAFDAGLIAPGLLGPRLARLFPRTIEGRRGGRKPAPERR